MPVPGTLTGGGVTIKGMVDVAVCRVVVKVVVVVERHLCSEWMTVEVMVVVAGARRDEQAFVMVAGGHVVNAGGVEGELRLSTGRELPLFEEAGLDSWSTGVVENCVVWWGLRWDTRTRATRRTLE